jgi:hypothetical protein
LETKPKRFGIVPKFVLLITDCFLFGPESFIMEQKEMISFDLADSGTNSHVMVSFLLDVGTFVSLIF